MRILITGASGFIGHNIAKAARELGAFVLSIGKQDAENGTIGVYAGYDFANLDWREVGPIDVLCHQAAITDTTCEEGELMFKVNLEDAKTLFKQAVQFGCKKIVYASSCAVYGDAPAPFREDGVLHPLNRYAVSKMFLDGWAMAFAKETGVKIIGLRYSNVFGREERHKGKAASMVSQLYWQMKQGNPRLFKNGEQKRDWVYVNDVVQANLLAIQADRTGVYNIGSGLSTSFNRLVEFWNIIGDFGRQPEYIDNPYLGKYQELTQVDISKAKEELGYRPKWAIREAMADYHLDEQLSEMMGR